MQYKKHRYPILILVLFILYILNNKVIRPYVYLKLNCQLCSFVVGVLPNFIGTLIVFIALHFYLNYSIKKNILFNLVLVLFMESERYLFHNASFDLFDIISSIVAILLCVKFYSKS